MGICFLFHTKAGVATIIRIVIDIEEYGNIQGTKELVAMALESLGNVRVVQVITGKEKR